MGFGGEVLFMMALGLVLLGPKRLHGMLKNAARFKSEFQQASHDIKSQLSAETDGSHQECKTDGSNARAISSHSPNS